MDLGGEGEGEGLLWFKTLIPSMPRGGRGLFLEILIDEGDGDGDGSESESDCVGNLGTWDV